MCLYKLLLLTPGISHSLTLWLFLSHVRSHPASSLWIVAPLAVSFLPSPPALHLPCFQSALSVYECRADINSIYYNNHYYFYSYCSFSLSFFWSLNYVETQSALIPRDSFLEKDQIFWLDRLPVGYQNTPRCSHVWRFLKTFETVIFPWKCWPHLTGRPLRRLVFTKWDIRCVGGSNP